LFLNVTGDHDYTRGTETTFAALYGIQKITIHAGYTTSPVKNDIALVKTSSVIVFNAGVGPTCLPWKYVLFFDFQLLNLSFKTFILYILHYFLFGT
jgi:hypothetical protein